MNRFLKRAKELTDLKVKIYGLNPNIDLMMPSRLNRFNQLTEQIRLNEYLSILKIDWTICENSKKIPIKEIKSKLPKD